MEKLRNDKNLPEQTEEFSHPDDWWLDEEEMCIRDSCGRVKLVVMKVHASLQAVRLCMTRYRLRGRT